MKQRHRSAKRMFREPKLPHDLTDQLREKILNLPGSVKADYLKEECFSKFVSKDTDPADARRNRAIFKWLCAEQDNAATSDRLILTPEDYNILPRVRWERFLKVCRDMIVATIGETPPVDALIGAFSGGASTSRKRTNGNPANKYVGRAHVTLDCLRVFDDVIIDECPGWFNGQVDLDIEVYPGNVMFTVPKKTDIDRVAAKEPDLNMYVQKGVGSYFRKCLRRNGINLNDQSINRSLALRGSITGDLATLDLSSASDSVTTELVFQLLPEAWFTLLDSVRSRVTIIDSEVHRNQMFSSMGNGFTFELESLIFWVLMRATSYLTGKSGVISVYGDDLIIPTSMVSEAMHVLSHCGFQVNPDKSHVDGPFRESCGGHYWNGVDITPFYVKAPIERIVDVIDVANKLRRWGDLRIGNERFSSVIDPDVEAIWLWLKSLVPSCLWGGDDLTYKYQLVSYDTSSHRLAEESERAKTGIGGLRHWLNTTWDREPLSEVRSLQQWLNTTWARDSKEEPVVTSVRTDPLNRLRLRRVAEPAVPRLDALFIHELERHNRENGG